MIPELASWMLGGAIAAPYHIASGFAVTALSEGMKHLTKQLETEEVTEMEHTELGMEHINPLTRMMNECLSMARGLYGISTNMHLGDCPTMSETQRDELRAIEYRLEKLMEGHRWQCRWHLRCSS